ncbi:MAG: hypothetical protein ACR2M1_08080 [Gemmatimonadaceae bacterium]
MRPPEPLTRPFTKAGKTVEPTEGAPGPVLDPRLYQDVPVPASLGTDLDKADYLRRFCDAWDAGAVPSGRMILGLSGWRDIADRFPVLDSPAYHALRTFFQWPEMPVNRSREATVNRWKQVAVGEDSLVRLRDALLRLAGAGPRGHITHEEWEVFGRFELLAGKGEEFVRWLFPEPLPDGEREALHHVVDTMEIVNSAEMGGPSLGGVTAAERAVSTFSRSWPELGGMSPLKLAAKETTPQAVEDALVKRQWIS